MQFLRAARSVVSDFAKNELRSYLDQSLISSVTASSVKITLNCDENIVALTLLQADTVMEQTDINVSCKLTHEEHSLHPDTKYNIGVNFQDFLCLLGSFTTKSSNGNPNSSLYVYTLVVWKRLE